MSQVVFNEWKETYRAEGRWEEKLENALNFLKENFAAEIVARCTGLPLKKVRELAAGLKKD